jgi:hypothetical protein
MPDLQTPLQPLSSIARRRWGMHDHRSSLKYCPSELCVQPGEPALRPLQIPYSPKAADAAWHSAQLLTFGKPNHYIQNRPSQQLDKY